MEYSEDEIQAFIVRAQKGDADAITVLFESMSDRIYRYLRFRVSDNDTAEDLTQTVFVEMLQSLSRYKERKETKFSTWLFQIARFRLIDHYRRQRPSMSLDDLPERAHPAFSPKLADPAETQRMDAALRTLPEKWQSLLHLRFREDLDTKDIARILGTSELNVRVMQHRALKALRQHFEKNPE